VTNASSCAHASDARSRALLIEADESHRAVIGACLVLAGTGRATAYLQVSWVVASSGAAQREGESSMGKTAVASEDDLLRTLARASGLSQREVRTFVQLGIVTFTGEPVQPALLRRLRRVRRMRRDLDLSLDAIVIILRLLDRLDALEGRTPPAGTSIRVLEDF
jgi:hypothetical protein